MRSSPGPSIDGVSRPARSSRRLTALHWGAIAIAGVLAVTLALVVRHRLAPKHLLVVSEGVLYRSATLPPEQLLDVVDEHGIRTVVNLRSLEENAEPWHAAQRSALEGAGVAMIDLPMPRSTTPVPEVEARWLALLDDPAAQPILVHCQYGVLRTGIMVSVYELAHRGVSSQGLFERMPQFGHDIDAPIRERIQLYLDEFARRRGAKGTGT